MTSGVRNCITIEVRLAAMASLHYGCCKVGSIAFLVICGSVDFFVVHVSGKLADTTDLAFPSIYPYALSTRKSAGLMTRKLSLTESQKTAQFFGTSSRRKRRTELQKSL